MFIDFVIHICDRIMRQTAEQNPTNSDPTNLPTATQETNNKPHNNPNSHMLTVLLVENESTLLEGLRCALEQSGYNVLTANSGESAIGICRKHTGKIDVLVSDVLMDQATGFEVAANVKATHPNAIVILMSGSPLSSFPQRGVTHDFLQKPFAHPELLAAISRHTATPATQELIRES